MPELNATASHVSMTVQDLEQYLIIAAHLKRMASGQRFAFYRQRELGSELRPDEIVDRLVQLPHSQIQRSFRGRVFGELPEAIFTLNFRERPFGTQCDLKLWATSDAAGQRVLVELEQAAGWGKNSEFSAQVDWFLGSGDFTASAPSLCEHFNDVLLPSAYPWLEGGLHWFTQRYLQTQSPVLVLYGPPGTGKTRLMRHLLRQLSLHRKRTLRVAYAADSESAAGERMFRIYMDETYDAMVLEDADHLLTPRTDGNHLLHRFLSASDGLLSPNGRRLIFSTNLPSRRSMDEALLRVGRCFACVPARRLTLDEASVVLNAMQQRTVPLEVAIRKLESLNHRGVSLAEVYAAATDANGNGEMHGQELPEIAADFEIDSSLSKNDVNGRYPSATASLGVHSIAPHG